MKIKNTFNLSALSLGLMRREYGLLNPNSPTGREVRKELEKLKKGKRK